MAAAATARRATKIYGSGDTAVVALDEVDLELEAGRFTSIMGPSGSGKSTLMHCLAGLDRLTSGQALIGDTDLATLSDDELTRLRRDRVGFVFQAFNLIPTLTAGENIDLPARIARAELDHDWRNQVIEILALGDRLDHRPTELSGGQQQRVAAARALVRRPEIVFADEPSGNLDTNSAAELLGFMRRAVDEFGQTIVMVTHDPTAAAYSDRVVFLRDGKPVDELYSPTVESILDRLKALEA
ncbi:MAG TPA: ABC transporter ATP-binding protein [Acidimicrobiia bacterium]|jgi:putative ABC transport system ATP-binding protein|nr:ABC transporter ATP-binding protein [Acidimicrobiia bacterium]